jgi:hypothetical protein
MVVGVDEQTAPRRPPPARRRPGAELGRAARRWAPAPSYAIAAPTRDHRAPRGKPPRRSAASQHIWCYVRSRCSSSCDVVPFSSPPPVQLDSAAINSGPSDSDGRCSACPTSVISAASGARIKHPWGAARCAAPRFQGLHQPLLPARPALFLLQNARRGTSSSNKNGLFALWLLGSRPCWHAKAARLQGPKLAPQHQRLLEPSSFHFSASTLFAAQ